MLAFETMLCPGHPFGNADQFKYLHGHLIVSSIVWGVLLIRLQTSTAQPLKFEYS